MQIKAQGKLSTIFTEDGKDTGELNGGIELTVEFIPDSELENLLLRDLLADSQHDTVTAAAINFGEKLISKFTLAPKSLDAARTEMALFSEWKRAGELFDNKPISFDAYKLAKLEAMK